MRGWLYPREHLVYKQLGCFGQSREMCDAHYADLVGKYTPAATMYSQWVLRPDLEACHRLLGLNIKLVTCTYSIDIEISTCVGFALSLLLVVTIHHGYMKRHEIRKKPSAVSNQNIWSNNVVETMANENLTI